MASRTKTAILVSGMLVSGTINTISKKLQLDCRAAGYFNHTANNTRTVHEFSKPWFQSLLMFLGEFVCFFIFLGVRAHKKRRMIRDGTYVEPAPGEKPAGMVYKPVFHWIFVLPAALDLIGSSVASIGLLFIDASIWQMLRGSLIVFAGLLSICILKRRLYGFHWTGIVLTVIGLAVVGTKSVFSGHLKHSSAEAALGVALVLLGSFISTLQMIVEEIFLKKHGFHPLQTVGMEGFYGTVLMIVIALPVVHFIPGNDLNGSYENQLDALYQLGDNALILVISIVFIFSIALFNYTGLSITRYLTTVHRTLVDALRTAFIWIIDVILFYAAGSQYGEPFNYAWDLIQIDGFALLVIGTLIYNEIMSLKFIPACVPHEEESIEDQEIAAADDSLGNKTEPNSDEEEEVVEDDEDGGDETKKILGD
ncbi:unnamed protein product [Calicophoron daubneyi]|uniref:Solute carrier family 35 member F6 n=1 Tax=Calicophoron daubneyi TaxID=300641 RepID=A0AAV2U188_CALDB